MRAGGGAGSHRARGSRRSPVRRPPRASTKAGDASSPTVCSAPVTSATNRVDAPGPQPTSNATRGARRHRFGEERARRRLEHPRHQQQPFRGQRGVTERVSGTRLAGAHPPVSSPDLHDRTGGFPPVPPVAADEPEPADQRGDAEPDEHRDTRPGLRQRAARRRAARARAVRAAGRAAAVPAGLPAAGPVGFPVGVATGRHDRSTCGEAVPPANETGVHVSMLRSGTPCAAIVIT